VEVAAAEVEVAGVVVAQVEVVVVVVVEEEEEEEEEAPEASRRRSVGSRPTRSEPGRRPRCS
jgi:hypothetical protein